MSPSLPPVPTGLQQLLRLAAAEERFASELLQRRSALAPVAAVELSRSERAILDTVPEVQLRLMIDGMPTPGSDRRTFLKGLALASLAVLAGAPLTGCPVQEVAGPDAGAPDAGPVRRKEIRHFGGIRPGEGKE